MANGVRPINGVTPLTARLEHCEAAWRGSGWLAAFVCFLSVVELRALLEYATYRMAEPSLWMFGLHLPLFYLCLGTGLSVIMSVCSGAAIRNTLQAVFIMQWLILLVPLLDILIYGRLGRAISYIPPSNNLVSQFIGAVFSRTSPSSKHISIGQFIVVHGAAIGVGIYSWRKSSRWGWGAMAWASCLVFVFLLAVIPASVPLASDVVNNWVRKAFHFQPLTSRLAVDYVGFLPSVEAIGPAVFLLLAPPIALCVAALHSPVLAASFVGNARFLRLGHYLLMVVLGVLMAGQELGAIRILLAAPTNPLAVMLLLEGIAAAFIGAVWLNDLHDQDIDRICSQKRPLACGHLEVQSGRYICIVTHVFAGLCGITLGPKVALIIFCLMALSFIYSAPPMRLRRFFPISIILIGIISSLVVVAGYTLISNWRTPLPIVRIILIATGIALMSSYKDMKDRDGDSRYGVGTLMTLLPLRYATVITYVCIALGCAATSLGILSGRSAVAMGIGGAVLAVPLVTWYARNERLVFGAHISFVIACTMLRIYS